DEVYSPWLDAGHVCTTTLRRRGGSNRYLQSPTVPARGTLALAGRSRLNTLETNSLMVIPRWPQSLRFRLVYSLGLRSCGPLIVGTLGRAAWNAPVGVVTRLPENHQGRNGGRCG